jgi:hypothetical protein
MAEVMAGFVCGFALALVATPIAALALVRAGPESALVRSVMPAGTSLTAVTVILHGFVFLGMTAIGIVLGLMLAGLEDSSPAGGLGSPNRVFTGLILAVTAIAVTPIAAVLPRWRMSLFTSGIAFAICFGWAMPWLSLLGPNG